MTKTRKFGEWVASYRNGYGTRPAPGETGPIVLRIADVSSGVIDLSNPRRGIVPSKDAETYRLEHGDLVFVRVNGARDIVGRCCVVGPGVPADAIFNDHLIRTRLLPGVDPEFARMCVSTQDARAIIEEAASTSAGQLAISQQVLDSIDVPDIPIEKQREIVNRFNSQMIEVESAEHALRAQLRELNNLANAIISESVSCHRTRPQSLGALLDEVKHGVGAAWSSYPVLGATRGGLAPAREQPGRHAPKYKPVFPGTLFYNPMRILIGSIAFVDEDDAPGITSPDYVALRGKPDLLDSRWFYYWLRSPFGARCIASLARGAVRERMLFGRLVVGVIEIPDHAVQVRASQALKELKPLRQAVESRLAEIELLPQKILAQAFEN